MKTQPAPRQPGEPDWKRFLRLSEQLVQQSDAAAQRGLIERTAGELLGAEARLWLARPAYPLPGQGNDNLLPDTAAPALVERARLEASPLLAETLDSPGQSTSAAITACVAAYPLVASERVLAVLLIERPQNQPLTPLDLGLLEGLAGHAANSLESARETHINRWRLDQLNLVHQVSAQIADVWDADLLCQRVTELIQSTFHYYHVAIFQFSGEPPQLIFRASATRDGTQRLPSGYVVEPGVGLIGAAAQTGESVVSLDVRTDPRFHTMNALPETLSEACLPLMNDETVLGVLDVQSDLVEGFHENDLLVLSALADSVALALRSSQLYSDLDNRAGQIATVSEVSHTLNSILELDELLEEVIALIRRRFNYPYVHIFSVHPGRRLVIFQAGSGGRSQAMRASEITYSLDSPQGIIAWVARHGQAYLTNDVENDPVFLPSPLPPANTRAELAVPLIFADQVLAVLDIQSDQPDSFSQSTLALFEMLAANLAVSYHNATLFRTEKWRRQVAESFRDIANKITNAVDLPVLLDHILERLETNLPCDISAVWLADDSPAAAQNGQRLRLAAIRGANAYQLEQAMTANPGAMAELEVLLGSEQPYIRSLDDPDSPIGSALGFTGDYSILVAPLRASHRDLGLLMLAHHTPGRYGSEAANMTSSFASYAAVAIQNTRLLHESQDQAWVATMLVQVAEATQSVLTVNDLLATMLRLTRLLVGVRKCAFFLRLENQPFYELKAWYGFTPSQTESAFYPTTLPGLVRLSEARGLVYLDDLAVDMGLPEAALEGPAGLRDSPAGLRGSPPSTVVLLPLMVRGEITGAFLVVLQPDSPGLQSLPLDAKSYAILQGISHQTSVTVENLRLLEARQEEAYVTAALLQVAQAVVSSNELHEVLETIVHLLPFLVGIEVCMVYRWDEDLQIFRPGNAHGENRRQEDFLLEKAFIQGEYRLLDAVLATGVAHISPMDMEGVEVEDWPLLPCQPLDAYLQNSHTIDGDWLLAFPLSAQDRILGVLLVRETNASPAFRERRLEILSGIAQQTSLALQNELLRREMVQNERTEREIQVARQIQRTFLPEKLPSLPGWEIDFRWQTARQVGGDFYDAFVLPDGRLGLVIADVSEKGLPAALYMTVARTLIRSTSRNNTDPAALMGEVNRLLFSESPQSMFITAVYAILDPATGDLTYANAGHNLPLLYCASTGDVQPLAKGSMALGVMPAVSYEDQALHLGSGDVLLLYTDGVPDTLDESGQDFAEARLRETLLRFGNVDAPAILSGIDQALSDFRQSTPLTDDVTMLALRRAPDEHKVSSHPVSTASENKEANGSDH